MRAKLLYSAIAATLLCLSASASATVMLAPAPAPSGTSYGSIECNVSASPCVSGYTENGFQVTTNGGTPGSTGFGAPQLGDIGYYLGSASLWNDNTDGGVTTLSKVGGGAFALTSMQLGVLNSDWTFYPNEYVTFTGNIDGGGTVTDSVLLLNNTSFQTVDFSGFSDVDSVTWAQGSVADPAFNQFTDIVLGNATPPETVTPPTPSVPEPTTVALISLAGLLMVSRKRQSPKG